MKILLVNPPVPNINRVYEYADEEGRKAMSNRVLVGPPLALNTLAGMLPDEDIIILDQKTELDQDPNYNYVEALIKEITDFKPDIVSFTVLTSQFNNTVNLLEIVKKIDSEILTTVGGIHATLCTKDFTGSKADIIAIGLGKASFYDIVQEYKNNKDNADYSKIPGLALNRGNSLYYTKALKNLSYGEVSKNLLFDNVLPNRKLTDKYNYKIPYLNKKIHYISTSQGCTNKCNFCSLWPMTDGRYFHREVESIISELKLMDEYPIIRFCDSNTLGDVKKATLLFNRIIEEGLNHHFYMADVRTDTVVKYPELIQLAAKAGVTITICGLEATTNEELEKYGKENTIELIQEGLKILNQSGILVNGNYIIRPDYDERNFERVGLFIENNPIFNSCCTILTPFPGTQQWVELQDQIVIKNLDYYNLTNAVTRTKLPEREFYRQLTEIYKTCGKSAATYHSIYGDLREKIKL
ncbi:B12-binding domain-containing radical SAM protein [Clostridium estertheticum]|uniref:B12-binding domain-containing radical SAM protein n=1 Tax=Clostridium estertheticum TaxID=238834 RepID=UPI001C7DF7EA|nr:radical SAM protein [Clostridium estertheticum]MBX4266838.1 B12-binding domain-containing radical SAM protein [Clostridium estertheticum]WLC89022.1 B12-binding domain-containing radical SAM protein [Clostridium estertheticum]